ncbi:tubulin polyglutamylase TTLL5 isoform 2-T2 [Discoglossus pictus]
MPVLMTRERPETTSSCEEEDGGAGDYSCVLWTGGSRRVPVLVFHAEAVLTKEPSLRLVGERYRLSYKMVRTDSRLVRSILTAHGFQEVHANSSDFNLMWTGSHVKPHLMRNLTSFQKVNHFPRSYELTRKDRLYKNVQRMQQTHGARNFHLLPPTYLLPSEYQDFCNAFTKDRGPWIVKPVASSRGRGVYLVNSPSQISMEENILVSRYIGNPLLIDGFKFDVRLYVLITSYDPLVVYLYEEGLTRFATVRYDRTPKNIKNQFMHLTNYSVNKKSGDYVSCDDPEVEDYGNKWSMSAMLRYLKQDSKDTAALMSQIEDLIIKTVIAGELPIATSCKSLLAHRGNCFELYGFDVLIDSNLKPWLLEVNLSPSLACDAPLDLKVKASLISDMLTLVGVECLDPHQRFARGGSAPSDPSKRSQKPLSQRPLSASDVDTRLQGGTHEKRRTSCTLGLSVEEIKVLRRVQDETERRGGFVRIFPRKDTWQLYGSFLEYKTSLNYMLAAHLFPDRPLVNGSGNRSTEEVSKLHTVLYERKLVSLQLRRAKRRGLTRRTTPHSSRVPEKSDDEQEEEDQAEEEEQDEKQDQHPLVQEQHPPVQEQHMQEQHPPVQDICKAAPIQPRRPNFLVALQQGPNLSKVQARLAFSCYLQRVQSRLQSEQDLVRPGQKEEEQMELVMRFLQRAARNLQRSLIVTLPDRSIPILERRRQLAKQLKDFIHLYNQETQHIISQGTADNGPHGVNPEDFQAFVAEASECDLEEVLTFYTHKNKSASIFLGTSSNGNIKAAKGRQEGSQDNVTQGCSLPLNTCTHQQSISQPGRGQGCVAPEASLSSSHSHSTNTTVSALSEPCPPRADIPLAFAGHPNSYALSGGSPVQLSSSAGQAAPPGKWAQTIPHSQTSNLGSFSSFQSAAQIYSQRLSRPSSTRSADPYEYSEWGTQQGRSAPACPSISGESLSIGHRASEDQSKGSSCCPLCMGK